MKVRFVVFYSSLVKSLQLNIFALTYVVIKELHVRSSSRNLNLRIKCGKMINIYVFLSYDSLQMGEATCFSYFLTRLHFIACFFRFIINLSFFLVVAE
jgi:hypothetical protein